MISPASDTAIRSATFTGYSENATAALPLSTAFLELAVPRAPPTKSIRLSVRMSRNLENRREQLLLQHADVERADRVRLGRAVRADGACASRPAMYIAISPRRRRRRRAPRRTSNRSRTPGGTPRVRARQDPSPPCCRQHARLVVREKRLRETSCNPRRPRAMCRVIARSRMSARARAALAAR